MRAAGAAVFMMAVLAAVPAQAQTAATPAAVTISESHLGAARTLLVTLQFEETAVATAMQVFDQQAQAVPETAAFRDIFERWARDVFGGDEAERAFAAMYAEAFSEADLVALTAFYRTPLGARVAAQQPQLAARGAVVGQELSAQYQEQLQERIMERVAELESAGADAPAGP